MRVTGGNGGQEEVSKLVAYCMSSGPVKLMIMFDHESILMHPLSFYLKGAGQDVR